MAGARKQTIATTTYATTVTVNSIEIKAAENQVFMLHNAAISDFEFGKVEKVLIPPNCQSSKDVHIVFTKTKKNYLPLFDLFEVTILESNMTIVPWNELGHFKPLYLYPHPNTKNKQVCSLSNMPILF